MYNSSVTNLTKIIEIGSKLLINYYYFIKMLGLLIYLQFKSILKHIHINQQVHGDKFAFYKEVLIGFVLLPFRLISNTFRKKILGRK